MYPTSKKQGGGPEKVGAADAAGFWCCFPPADFIGEAILLLYVDEKCTGC